MPLRQRQEVQKVLRGLNLKVILEPSEEGGYTALVPSLPSCISEGETRQEALLNIREAILLYLEPVVMKEKKK
jgi:predicted RNase H-like HicB family nuclease